jgi:hypothetical protein
VTRSLSIFVFLAFSFSFLRHVTTKKKERKREKKIPAALPYSSESRS